MDEHAHIALQLTLDATSADDRRRFEALKEIRSMVELFPTELNYRLALTFALGIEGSCKEAITQAQMLEELDTGTHEVEYCLAQVYLNCGDSSSARRHGLEAERLARSAEDHQDSRDLLRRIDAT